MCRSDGLIGLSSTRTSASPGAKGGVGISASFNTLFSSPVSVKINAFINTSWVFRRPLIPAGCSTTSGTRSGAGDEGEHLRGSYLPHAFAERNLPLCHSLLPLLRQYSFFAAVMHSRIRARAGVMLLLTQYAVQPCPGFFPIALNTKRGDAENF